jgi:hypothetical protein
MNVSKGSLSIGQQGFIDRVEADKGRTIGLAENSAVQQVQGVHYYNYCARSGQVIEGQLASSVDADLETLIRKGREAETLGRKIRRVRIGSKKVTPEQLAEMQERFDQVMAEIDNGGQQ